MRPRFHGYVRRQLAWLLMTVFCLGGIHPVPAGSPATLTPDQFRAACMRFFALDTSWPAKCFASRAEPLRIAILGKPNFVTLLAKLVAGETVSGGDGGEHPIEITSLHAGDQLSRFHVVYFEKLDDESRETLRSLTDDPVVTVGETPEFVRAGGILAFDIHEGKPVYFYNLKAMLAANVRLNTDLIRLGHPLEEKAKPK